MKLYLQIVTAQSTVMGDHLHKKDEFMFSYRLSKMKMGSMLQGKIKSQ